MDSCAQSCWGRNARHIADPLPVTPQHPVDKSPTSRTPDNKSIRKTRAPNPESSKHNLEKSPSCLALHTFDSTTTFHSSARPSQVPQSLNFESTRWTRALKPKPS